MEEINVFFNNFNFRNLLLGIGFLALAIITCVFVNKLRDKLVENIDDTEDSGVRKKATITTACGATKVFVVVFAVLAILQINGINVSSILTGLGIISAVTALAIQDVAKDFIQGMRIASEGFYKAGDYIRYQEKNCQVVEFSALTTRLTDLANNDTIIVCNRDITKVTQISGKEYIDIALPYDMSPEESEQFMQGAMKDVYAIKGVKSCKYLGLKEIDHSSAIHLVMISCHPKQARQMIRNTKMVFLKLMNENGIEVPYNKLEILEPTETNTNNKR